MDNLSSRMAERTILVEGSDSELLKVFIRDSGHEVFLFLSKATVEQIPRIVCRALDRKMDMHLAKTANRIGRAGEMVP
jgi:hypothetical protein